MDKDVAQRLDELAYRISASVALKPELKPGIMMVLDALMDRLDNLLDTGA